MVSERLSVRLIYAWQLPYIMAMVVAKEIAAMVLVNLAAAVAMVELLNEWIDATDNGIACGYGSSSGNDNSSDLCQDRWAIYTALRYLPRQGKV
jgi:hypothetical protein